MKLNILIILLLASLIILSGFGGYQLHNTPYPQPETYPEYREMYWEYLHKYYDVLDLYNREISDQGWIFIIDGQQVVISETEIREYIKEMLEERIK